jgi:hypothetical protein
VKVDTAWLLHNKILRAMADREEAYLLRGKIQIDDSYLGGELPGGKAGRGSENKIPIVAAVSLNEAGHPIHARITAVSGFSSEAIAEWAKQHLAPGSQVPQFRWINTLLGNLKTSFNGTFHAFNFDKYARRYLGGYCFRFNRRFSLAAMTERIANAVCCCMPCTERDLRVAEFYG